MITTTLHRIRKQLPCQDSWRKLLGGIGKTQPDNERLPYADILRICGLPDALWATQVEPQHDGVWRLFAVRCARRAQHLMTDPRSLAALDVAERYAHQQATDAELVGAFYAARSATDGEWPPKWEAQSVARSADWSAVGTTLVKGSAAVEWSAQWAAMALTWEAERAAQATEFLRMVGDKK
jgi:hypothetical protein